MLFGQMATRIRMTGFIRRNNRADSIVISIERLGKFLPGFFLPDSFISYLCDYVPLGALIILSMVGIPCLIFLLWCLTPSGKRWLKEGR